jgi:hypothetical protein
VVNDASVVELLPSPGIHSLGVLGIIAQSQPAIHSAFTRALPHSRHQQYGAKSGLVRSGGDEMVKKLSIVLSVVAVMGLAFAAPASAQYNTNNNKNVQVNRNANVNRNINRNINRNTNVNRNFRVNRNTNVNRNITINRSVNRNFVIGRRYNDHIWYGRNRHFWHGRWYAYGDGPCWINVDGLWFWNELDCPI